MSGVLRAGARALNDGRLGGAIVRGALPEPLFRQVATRLGGRLPEMIDLSVAAVLRDADVGTLSDPVRMEREILPALGLSDDVPWVLPDDLQAAVGKGLRHWQYPSQFAPYLVELSRLPIRSYLEIGVRHGGSFIATVEYLSRFRVLTRATAVDLDDVPVMRPYAAERPAVRFVRADSRSRRFRRLVEQGAPWDLVLIDGNHHYRACRSDLDAVLPHANVVALHDIVDHASPGVRRVWAEIKASAAGTHELHEFTAQYDEVLTRVGHPVLGIGVAVRRTFAAATRS